MFKGIYYRTPSLLKPLAEDLRRQAHDPDTLKPVQLHLVRFPMVHAAYLDLHFGVLNGDPEIM